MVSSRVVFLGFVWAPGWYVISKQNYSWFSKRKKLVKQLKEKINLKVAERTVLLEQLALMDARIDEVDEFIAKIDKKITDLSGIVNKIDQKLNNKKFIERAPSDIINQNISNKAKIENDILSLRSLRDTLSD